MAIEKFKFVSPGVQVHEIDESILPTPFNPIGPVVIGNTAKGPAMQPVVVSTISELEKIFGAPSNGVVGAVDVWRTGVTTAPTLATYAAKAFLTNSFPITVIRLAGVEKSVTELDEPGWEVDKVTHLFAKSGSNVTTFANIYHNSTTSIQIETSASTYASSGSASLDASNEFTLRIINNAAVPATTESYKVCYDSTKNSFIRDVINTNPSRLDTDGYFLGETFEKAIKYTPENVTWTEVFVTSSTSFGQFKDASGSVAAASPWVVGDVVSGSWDNYSRLFRFVGLNNGSYLAKDIKVTIENIKPTKNPSITRYGTFDVVVKKLFETATFGTVERFNGCTLDPDADGYIIKRIGDSYRKWNAESQRYEEFGTYQNLSAYIRVELSGEDIAATDLPRGFLIPGMPSASAYGISGLTVKHPTIQVKSSCRRTAGKTTRFGLVSDITNNADLVDILSQKPTGIVTEADTLFHMRFLSSSVSTNTISYLSGTHYDHTDLFGSGSVLGFDMPMYGGTDAKDITLKDPFINDDLLDGKTEITSAAFRAIKQAIDIVAQPEVIDMNMLVIPGVQNTDITDYMMEVCKTRGDSLALIDLPGDYLYAHETGNEEEYRPRNVTEVVEGVKGRRIDNSYGAAYFPAVFVPSEGIFMPASVAALGAIGGTEGRTALWFAPAGFNRGGLTMFNAGIGVSRAALSLTASDRDALYDVAINPIATFPNEGVVIFGQKTLQGFQSALDRVNVRRLVNYCKKEISRAATRVLFEPNVENTWKRFKGVVEPFLLRIKNGYGLEDAKVVLDRTTTTADLIDRNIMYCKIYIKPTRAIEYIAIDFIVTNSGASFNEGQ